MVDGSAGKLLSSTVLLYRYSLLSAHYKTVYSYVYGFLVAEKFNSIVPYIVSLLCT